MFGVILEALGVLRFPPWACITVALPRGRVLRSGAGLEQNRASHPSRQLMQNLCLEHGQLLSLSREDAGREAGATPRHPEPGEEVSWEVGEEQDGRATCSAFLMQAPCQPTLDAVGGFRHG